MDEESELKKQNFCPFRHPQCNCWARHAKNQILKSQQPLVRELDYAGLDLLLLMTGLRLLTSIYDESFRKIVSNLDLRLWRLPPCAVGLCHDEQERFHY